MPLIHSLSVSPKIGAASEKERNIDQSYKTFLPNNLQFGIMTSRYWLWQTYPSWSNQRRQVAYVNEWNNYIIVTGLRCTHED